MKKCSKCKIEKDDGEFSKDRSAKDGLQDKCKDCERKYRLENKEHISRRNKEYNKLMKDRPKINIISKICGKCKIEKGIDEFNKNKSRKDGLQFQCKCCNKEYRGKPEVKERNKKYHKEYNPTYQKEYYSIPENKEHRKQYDRERNKIRRSIPEFKEHKREYQKKYYSIPKNKEHRKEYLKEYAKSNPNKIRAYDAKWRSLKAMGSIVEFTKEQLIDRMLLWNGHCAYCGKEFNDNKLWEQIDHVIPLSRGGLNIPANLRPACKHCNCSKGKKLLSEWLKDLSGVKIKI